MTQGPEKIPVLCLSLDNVLTEGESLPKLVSFLKRYALLHGKFGLMKRVYVIQRRRNNQDISQRRFKFELVRALRSIRNLHAVEDFVAKLLHSTKPLVKNKAEEIKARGGRIVVATSAAGEYAKKVAEYFGADHCFCTPSFDEFRKIYPQDPIDYDECLGTEKVRRLQSWLDKIGGKLDTVITGESDDLPLLTDMEAENRYVVAPSRQMRRSLKRRGIFFETL